MEHFELTRELMQKANTYMPLVQKTILAEMIARMCLKTVKPLNEKDTVDDFLIIPAVVGEDNYKKECMLLNTLLSHYFDIKIPKMTADVYDKYMGSHIVNQLERYKNDKEFQHKAFDILTDYKTIRRMVESELYNLKIKENDLAERVLKGISIWSAEKMTNDPEYLAKITEGLKSFAKAAKKIEVAAVATEDEGNEADGNEGE